MALKPKKKKSILLTIITVLLAIVFAAVAFVLCFYVIWSVFDRPAVVFNETEVTVEVHSDFDPVSVLGEWRNISMSHIRMDASELNVDEPGDYEVRFVIDAFPVSKELLNRVFLGFLSPDEQEQILLVHVRDTRKPELKLIKGPVNVKKGDVVKVEDLIALLEDETDVKAAFADGSTELHCDVEGNQSVSITAVDESGNKTTKKIKLTVEGPDETPPEIFGADDRILKVGESFSPMEGVYAKDNKDGDVEVWIESGTAPDLDHPDVGYLTYRADDAAGNETRIMRTVAVYADVVGEGENRFGLLWDNHGIENQPYLVCVNRMRNVVTVYGKGADGNYTDPVKSFVCSVGTDTPVGVFKTLERYRWHALWENSFGQYATRITGHILFHSVPYEISEDPASLEYEEYNKLGTSASLGCVRMTVEDCKWIYENCPDGFTCIIYDDDMSNGPLGKPKPIYIDADDLEKRGWDPTDPDPNNPWKID